MDAQLSGLARAAGEHGAEDGDVEAALHGGEGHLHVGGEGAPADGLLVPAGRLVAARAPAGGQLGAVVARHVGRVHVGDAQQAAAEHALPLALDHVLAVVRPQHALGPPLLLEERLAVRRADLGAPHPHQVVQVVLVPCLPEFLYVPARGEQVSGQPYNGVYAIN
ncbi:hypothetical protein DL765_009595 [Monosporascus sp. GIB2]|nr:hypothetical protein DL765_009595 [Monosporascus sp. GIB2]